MGIEPTSSAWEAEALPLDDTRLIEAAINSTTGRNVIQLGNSAGKRLHVCTTGGGQCLQVIAAFKNGCHPALAGVSCEIANLIGNN